MSALCSRCQVIASLSSTRADEANYKWLQLLSSDCSVLMMRIKKSMKTAEADAELSVRRTRRFNQGRVAHTRAWSPAARGAHTSAPSSGSNACMHARTHPRNRLSAAACQSRWPVRLCATTPDGASSNSSTAATATTVHSWCHGGHHSSHNG